MLLHAIVPVTLGCGGVTSAAGGDSNEAGGPAGRAGAGGTTGGAGNGGSLASGSGVLDAGHAGPDAPPPNANGEGGPGTDAGSRRYPICDSWPDSRPYVSPINGPECAGLEAFVLSTFQVTTADGGDRIAPGEQATVRVSYTLTGSADYNSYPCIGVMADNPAVSFGRPQNWPNHQIYYAKFAGEQMTIERQVLVGASIAPGTVVRFIAWATALTSACIQNVAELPVTVN